MSKTQIQIIIYENGMEVRIDVRGCSIEFGKFEPEVEGRRLTYTRPEQLQVLEFQIKQIREEWMRMQDRS